jgi:hypothetical protein
MLFHRQPASCGPAGLLKGKHPMKQTRTTPVLVSALLLLVLVLGGCGGSEAPAPEAATEATTEAATAAVTDAAPESAAEEATEADAAATEEPTAEAVTEATAETAAEATAEATAEPAAAAQPLPTWTPIPTPAPGALAVDASQVRGPISPYVYGTNYGPWVSLRMETLPLAEKSGITVIRYPGGEWGDHNDLQTYQIDQLVDLARRMGAEPYIHIRFLDSTPEKAASIVQYTQDKGYNVKFWSIGNEPSLYEGGGNPWPADAFAQEWRKFAEAMKAVDPNIVLIGPEIHQFTGDLATDPKDSKGQDWMRTFLQTNGDMVDIVSFHRYPFPLSTNAGAATVDQLLANPPQWDGIVRTLRDLVRELTGRDLPVAVTEFNSHWTRSISGETTPDSFLSALWLGDVLGRLIEQRVDMATQFLLVSGSDHSGFGVLERYGPRPAYFVYQLYQQFGQELLFSSSGIEGVSLHAALRDDGALTILAINVREEPVTAPLSLQGFTPGGDAEVYLFDAEHNAEQVENVTVADGDELTLAPRAMTLFVVR